MPTTPMMQQYQDAKAAVGDALLLFRMGDFYELFFEDAKVAASKLGLSLTSRDKGENPIPMAGFPHHQLDGYLAKILATGHRAAVCEQVEDPKLAKGIVKREVTRIVSAGTVTDDSLLDPQRSNFLVAIAGPSGRPRDKNPLVGLAWIDISTGQFQATASSPQELPDHLSRLEAAEVIVNEDDEQATSSIFANAIITRRPAWAFGYATGQKQLADQFGTQNLDGFGFDAEDQADSQAVRAAGAILDYLQETQKSTLGHVHKLQRWSSNDCLEIDAFTRQSLELSRTMRSGSRQGSLLGVIDRTVTSMGSRLLADWLAAPLLQVESINNRLDAVAEFVHDSKVASSLRDELKSTYDVERLLARVTTGRASPRDLGFVAETLVLLPKLKAKLSGRKSELLCQLEDQIDLCPDIRARLEQALVESPPLSSKDGGIICEGHVPELDRLREIYAGGKQWMAKYQAEEIQRTGISNLKVGYNKVFGYYLEVTHAQRDKVPDDYTRKQTLKNAERYITPELKQYEEEVLTAEEKSKQLEYEIFLSLREMVAAQASRLRTTAEALAEIDVLASLAELARSRGYVRPEICDEPALEIIAGRHPVLDIIEPEGTFVPNDVLTGVPASNLRTDSQEEQDSGSLEKGPHILLITGPNMAGKSTYIRQAALLTILAQIGSFVPAQQARIGIADRVFARVGASDELARGQSTFMVEMTETARILNTATRRSLVILDEIGRGTSTYDGLSLAWSIVEHLHDHIGCRTLFATHYHELTQLEAQLEGVRNCNVAVKEWDGKVVFLHQVVCGAADKSYGIHVAQLAGVPAEVNERAKQVLSWLENQHQTGRDTTELSEQDTPARNGNPQPGQQLTLFEYAEHPLLDEIRRANLEETTPLAALQLIESWQRGLKDAWSDRP